ncbi:MAG TPA: N-acetyltransferase, partial [Rhizomicrobium sp.]|nr:N-acetyltransferase [Rhizomicrobium sp.]
MANGVKEASWQIRHEAPEDRPLVDALNAASFGPGRYVKAAYRLREGVDPIAALSFVAVEKGVFRGSVRFWPISVGTEKALLLGPLAVQSDQRGRGIGIALMNKGVEEARARGHRAIILVGDLPYYSRVGFKPLARGRVTFPGPVDPS